MSGLHITIYIQEDNNIMSESQVPQTQGTDFALVPTNKNVIRASLALKRKPATLIKHIKRYLSSPVEQSIYLEIAAEFRHKPDTFKSILNKILDRDLIEQDLMKTFDGTQWHETKVDSIEPVIIEALHLIQRVPNDYEDLRIKASTAAVLVMSYGEDAISFIDSIMDDWIEIAEILKFGRYASRYPTARAAIWLWLNKILPYCKQKGIPDQIRFMDYFDDDCGRLRFDLISYGKEVEDILEENEEI